MIPKQAIYRPEYLENLATALLERYMLVGNIEDIERAIPVAEEAKSLLLVLMPSELQDAGGFLAPFCDVPPLTTRKMLTSNLGILHCNLYERTGNLENLDVAISNFEELSALTPSNEGDEQAIPNYAWALSMRFQRTGDRKDLDQAIMRIRQALEVKEIDRALATKLNNNLGELLRQRFLNANSISE
ncbi:hypothetical protein SLS55_004433 [Diplodia seriata]|uniref:Tetratricopeptide repeat protein n=1 Tax=Diplodia seriata TaxID=420778 RepID=A0ABR3CJC8_9PEZI